MTPEEKVIDLHALADPLVKEIFKLVKGEAAVKGPLMAELTKRLAIYASRGDKAGMSLVYGRVAAALQNSKLEAEASLENVIKLAGGFLLDVASNFLPRFIKGLEDKIT